MCKITLVVLSPRITDLRIQGQKLHPENTPVAPPSMNCLTTGTPTAPSAVDQKQSSTLCEKASPFIFYTFSA